jgi:hypothetical protein
VRRVATHPDHLVPNEQCGCSRPPPPWRHHADVHRLAPGHRSRPRPTTAATDHSNRFIADLKNGPLATCPRPVLRQRRLLVLASMAFNLTRASGALGLPLPRQGDHREIRRQCINVPARPVRSARRVHLPSAREPALGGRWLDCITAGRRTTAANR